ncbi:MAG: hypothetical protein KHY89_05725 [Butyricicoccus pullicaecorum]|nr:hypothetical protein [Butyricicoccus pullicaecorum]
MENSISLPNEFMIIHFFQAKDFFQMMFNGQNYKIIGKDDVENFVGLSPDKRVFLLNTSDKSTIYISKNIEAFLMEIEMYHRYSKIPFPNNPTEKGLKEREKHFRELLMQIDGNACHDENTYWSYIAEEMGYGII